MDSDTFKVKGTTIKREYRFIGYTKSGIAVYGIYETKFSLKDGIEYINKLVAYCDSNKKILKK